MHEREMATSYYSLARKDSVKEEHVKNTWTRGLDLSFVLSFLLETLAGNRVRIEGVTNKVSKKSLARPNTSYSFLSLVLHVSPFDFLKI